MKRFSITLVALAALLATVHVRAEEEPEEAPPPAEEAPPPDAPVDVKKMLAEFKELMKSKDPAERKAAVATVSTAKDPKIAAELAKHLRDRDPEVQADVCRAIGVQGDPKAGMKLIAMLKSADDPALLAAICDGIAGAPHPRAIEPLEDIVKDAFNKLKNAEVATAAIRAMGQIKDKAVIGPLIGLCGRTNPVAGGGGGGGGSGVSEEARKFLGDFKNDIIGSLQNVTGLSYKSPPVWASWWKDNERSFKLPDGPIDVSTLSRYRDAGYGFDIARPADSWKLSQPGGDGVILITHPEEGNEGQTDATLEVAAWHISDYATKTVEERIKFWEDWVKRDFKDVKESEVRKIAIGGEKGKELWVKGLWGGFPVEIRRIVILRKDLFFDIRVYMKSSVSQPLRDDLDKALKSISFF